jgi:hypothetical protein
MERKMNFPDESRLPAPYLKPRQAQRREPTDYENLLGDALEAAFASEAWELDALIAKLNDDGIRTPEGAEWTAANFEATLAKLEP